jgi:DNA-binding SARP family transcriptional activator
MGTLTIRLFGRLEVQRGDQVLDSLNANKVQELFCYLLLYRDRPHPRETLADLLWGEVSTVQSKNYLRKTLWQLQAALDSQAKPGNTPVLLVEPDWVRLNPETDLWLDVMIFEQAFTFVQGMRGKDLDYQSAGISRSAVDLYRGNLLEGWYLDWCLYERERLQHMYLATLDKLMDYYESHHEYEIGMTYGVCALRYDRARERTHRRLMRLQCLAGDRTGALHQYERCAAALDEELGVKPAKRTVALYEQIRADQLDSPTLASAEVSQATMAPFPDVLGHLQQLQLILSDVQRKVQQDIQAIQLVLKGRR